MSRLRLLAANPRLALGALLTLLLAAGAVVAAGPVERTLTGEAVSACFGIGVEVGRHDGRWLATMTGEGAACLAGPSRHMVS